MSKIIKKQIKRSLPIILILLLLNLSIYGLLFNFNFFQFATTEAVSLLTEARADTASSTVTVKNAPPAFTVSTEESPISSSTSPVNVGGSISFLATADDVENNSYYLVVCSTNAVTASTTGGEPTCPGTRFCVSGLTGDTSQATCVYDNVADPGAESQVWYSFVCDNHSSEAECSTSNQGSGDSGSPYYVNHAPVLTSASTTDNFKDPGGIFTVTAYVTDSDTQGGVDDLTLDVCGTASWATSTGCAVPMCTGTSTTPDITCQFTDTAPTPHGNYTYYAYVKDWHEMPASGNYQSATYDINNVAPTVSNVILNVGNNITLNIKGAAAKTVWATSTSVTDNNGCDDIVDGTSTIYMSNAVGAQNCAINDNDCYQALAATCYISDCGAQPDSIATMACSVDLAFHAIPTDAATGNTYAPYNWLAAINAYDQDYTSSAISTSTVEVVAAAALGVTETTIPYGIIVAGQNTGAYNATTTVVNFGNTPLDSDIDGTWMVNGGNTINEDQQEFDLANFNYGTGTFTLSSTTPITVDVVAARPTSGVDVSDQVFWGIAIPVGILSGDYTGTNTFTAALDPNGIGW